MTAPLMICPRSPVVGGDCNVTDCPHASPHDKRAVSCTQSCRGARKCILIKPPKVPRNQPLFEHMLNEHGLTLLESEMSEIEAIVLAMNKGASLAE